jgi:DNA-binding CsgD family transcriptional regulator
MAGKKQLNLTDGQKDCLRMVDDLLTSKEIARKLGISRFTVDQRLDSARRKLNAPNRKEAAKIYVAIEARCLPESIVYDPANIADFDFRSILPAVKGVEGKQSDRECIVGQDHHVIAQSTVLCQSTVLSQSTATTKPKPFSGVVLALLETGLISIILVSAMTLIIDNMMRALS